MQRNLVDVVTETLQLLDTTSSLFIRVVPCTNCSHACGLITSIALGTVVKVRIWPTRTVTVMKK